MTSNLEVMNTGKGNEVVALLCGHRSFLLFIVSKCCSLIVSHANALSWLPHQPYRYLLFTASCSLKLYTNNITLVHPHILKQLREHSVTTLGRELPVTVILKAFPATRLKRGRPDQSHDIWQYHTNLLYFETHKGFLGFAIYEIAYTSINNFTRQQHNTLNYDVSHDPTSNSFKRTAAECIRACAGHVTIAEMMPSSLKAGITTAALW